MGKKKLKSGEASVLYAVIMWALALVCVYPFIMMVIISFRHQGDVYEPLFGTVRVTLSNYKEVLTTRYFMNWYWNTFRTVIVSIFFRLLVTIPAAYAFSRMTEQVTYTETTSISYIWTPGKTSGSLLTRVFSCIILQRIPSIS